jgi:peptidyl-tRNA hydrolase, PTH1 family
VKWIVGLGNPGKRYLGTRHNVGFLVVDRFRERQGFGEYRERFGALFSERGSSSGGEKVCLLKPMGYMNRSGQAVREALDYFRSTAAELVVVHDDLDLPLGRLRYRARGSSGGHRGVASLVDALGTEEFHRLKVGIGRPGDPGREGGGKDPADYVLEAPGPEERAVLNGAAVRAAESLEVWLSSGIDRAATLYNAPEPGGDKDR